MEKYDNYEALKKQNEQLIRRVFKLITEVKELKDKILEKEKIINKLNENDENI